MSNMIMCDGCKRTMYADSRSDKGDYHEIWIDRSDGWHLCRDCYTHFMKDILHLVWSDDEEQFVTAESVSAEGHQRFH